jgi:NADPH:quinone reductase-like Zn-dependent oxidoreductase
VKAVYMENFGGPEVLQYGDQPDPIPGLGEVLVDIHAASVNGADWKVRLGLSSSINSFPHILGRDFSGIVSAADKGVDEFCVGDAVFGVCAVGQEGTYAEKIAIKSEILAKKPASLSHVEATSIALIGLTALVSIEDTLQLKRGEKILIQGGAGGVAGFAIQLAKHIGAYVITTASAKNHEYLRNLGADETIDYNVADFTQIVSDCDAVFETVGGDDAQRSFSILKSGGRAAFIASGPSAPKPSRDDVQALRPAVGRDRLHLERVSDLVTSGIVALPEIKEFALSDAAKAHQISEGRHLRGKLVFKMNKVKQSHCQPTEQA